MKQATALLLLAFPALAAGGPPAPASDGAIPSEMPECQTLPPDAQFRHFTGYGIAESESLARKEAEEAARRLARQAVEGAWQGKRQPDQVLAQVTQIDERAHFVPKGYRREERWRACHTLQAPDWAVEPELTREAMLEELRRQGREIQGHQAASSLRLEPPTWAESQCSVGGAGEAIVAEIAGAYRETGLRVDDSQPTGPSLRVLLADLGDRVNLLTTHVGDDGVQTRLAPVRFFPFLYGIEGEPQSSCLWDRELGLEEGHRAGADGRTVRISIPGNTGSYCEGDRVEPVVVVDRPSRVRVFSVTRDGAALLIWPYLPESDGRVERTLSLGQAEVHRPLLGEERLIAVALPEDDRFGEAESWRACIWPDPFDASAFPQGAAVGSVGFLVAPTGTQECPKDVHLTAFPDFPTCGT